MRSVLIISIFVLLPGFAQSATIYVPDDYSKIQDAINASVNGDKIIVRSGTYVENIDFLGKAISLKSQFGPNVTTIDGNQSGSVVKFVNNEKQDSLIEGFTLTNGIGTPNSTRIDGGGIFCYLASPSIINNIIINNSAKTDGGGIYCHVSSPLIYMNIIDNNIAETGTGGGVGCGGDNSSPEIIRNIIINNTAGSGLDFTGGGGIASVTYACPTITNNIIADNIADMVGGGIYCYHYSDSIITLNTITGNMASGQGGGLACRINSNPSAKNNIIYGNSAGIQASEIYSYGSSNPTVNYCDVKGGWSGTGNIDVNPLWYDPANGDYHLQQDPCQKGIVNSCVDSGDPSSQMITGTTRTDGIQDSGIIDMGFHFYHDTIHHVPGEFITIQSAIDYSISKDIVLVAPGSYIENIDYKGKDIVIRSDVDGNNETFDIDPFNTIIDGSQKDAVVKIKDVQTSIALLSGFTILNGLSDYGGGIQCYESSPTITHNIIKDNGVFYFGAGIGCSKNSDPLIENNIIYDNIAYGQGGGIGCESSNPTIVNTTIFGNSAVQIRGGGFWCWNSEPVIKNSIIWNNDSPVGPEIFVANTPNPSILTISYSVVRGGEAGVGIEPGCTLIWGEGMIDQDPLFVDPNNQDFHLTWISPCINRGSNDGIPDLDIDGEARPQMGTVDMGADEFKGVHALETTTFTLSEAGGTIDFDLHGGISNGGREYIMLGSVTGTAPGNLLPGGYVTMPLNWDLFTFMIIDFLNTPTFMNFHGTLSPLGHATATFDTLGPIVGTAGIMPSFAYALNAPWDFVSNPINVEIIP